MPARYRGDECSDIFVLLGDSDVTYHIEKLSSSDAYTVAPGGNEQI
jgi:hypothetical protein